MATNPYKCKHPRTEVRGRLAANNTLQYLPQCLECGGNAGPFVKKCTLGDVNKVPRWDVALEDAGLEESKRGYEMHREEIALEGERIRAERRERLSQYYATPEWKTKSRAVLERDGFRCRAGFPVCTVRATQAHHLTYDHVFNEPLFDLVSVCHSCHCELHAHMKQERQSA